MELIIKPASPKLKILYKRSRFKCLHGGRGSAKSWGIVEALLYFAVKYKTRILCCREIQKSIKESSYKLIKNTIDRLELNSQFTILRDEIRCNLTGSEFIFEGLAQNTEKIKSMEGIDICWVEEADKVSAQSLDILIPTIRKVGSELWFSWNSQNPTDAISKKFQGSIIPDNTLIANMTFEDNKYFTQENRDEMEFDKKNDYELYLHKWLGHYRQQGDCRLISAKTIGEVSKRFPLSSTTKPKILGVDPARFGDDRAAAIVRQGNEIKHIKTWAKSSATFLASELANLYYELDIDVVIIEGTGVGGGTIDRLRELIPKEKVIEFVHYNYPKHYKYLNIRTEVWHKMAEWLEDEDSAIPNDSGLIEDLMSMEYYYNSHSQKCLLEKKVLKAKGLKSPDVGDALAFTFANDCLKIQTTSEKSSEDNEYYEEEEAWHG